MQMAATTRPVLRPLTIPQRKSTVFNETPTGPPIGGTLSPDLQPNTPPTFPKGDQHPSITKIGDYLLLDRLEAFSNVVVYKAVHVISQQHYTCKVSQSL